MKKKRKTISSLSKFGIALAAVILLDQITKLAIRSNILLNSSMPVFEGILYLTHVRNTGVSFGLFKGANLVFVLVSIIALGYFGRVYWKKKKYPVIFGLICGGITGNLIDRIFLGGVVDFVDFRIWPIFNVADASISLGVLLLIIILVKRDEEL